MHEKVIFQGTQKLKARIFKELRYTISEFGCLSVSVIFSPPNFSLEWAIDVVMRRRHQHFRKSTSSNAMVLKFCTDFLDGSEGRVRKFCAISLTWARIMGKKGLLRMRLSL